LQISVTDSQISVIQLQISANTYNFRYLWPTIDIQDICNRIADIRILIRDICN